MSRSFTNGRGGMHLVALAALLGAITLPSKSQAISRDEVMVRAKAFAFHPWTCTSANLTASCDSGYHSVYTTGDFMGLPYDWGGYVSLFNFDQRIADGQGAGSYPSDGILECTTGLDCSGFVSQTWGASHTTTTGMQTEEEAGPNPGFPIIVDAVASVDDLLAGDAINDAGYHVVLFSRELGNGEPEFYESVYYNVHVSTPGWSWVDGFRPIRYKSITGTSVGNPSGTPENPIVVPTFSTADTYVNSGNTASSASDVLDGCDAAPGTGEAGPEVIYEVTFGVPGTLTAQVSGDGGGVDIDVHLYTSMNTNDCIARDNTDFTTGVDCGTYYVVVDTYSSGSTTYPGAYTLTLDFTPTGGACGDGPPAYDFVAGPGDPCMNGSTNNPFCNENLGASTCLIDGNTTFCSRPCSGGADCADFPGGCCEDIGNGEYYCLTSAYCGGGTGGSGTGGSGTGGFGTGGSGTGNAGNTGTGGFGTGGFSTGGFGTGNTGTGNTGTGSSSSSDEEGGCAVAATGSSSRAAGAWLLALGLVGLGRRRRRS